MDAAQALGAAQDSLQSTVSKERSEMQPAIDKFNQTVNQSKPQIPDQQKAPTSPTAQQLGVDINNYIIAMGVLSAVAGAFSRQHATTALKAFSGAVNGYQNGNKEAFEKSSKEWEQSNKAALENNKILTEKYEAIMNDRSLTEQEAMNELKMVAFKYKDQTMADSDNLAIAAKNLEIRTQAQMKAQEHADAMQQHQDFVMEMFDKKEQLKKDEEEAQEIKYEAWKKTPEAVGAANAYAKGVPPSEIIKGWGKSAQQNFENIKRLAFELNPNLDISKATIDYSEKKREASALATRSAPAKIAVKEMDKLAQPMIDAISKIDRVGIPSLNALSNAAAKGVGGPDVVRANLAVQEFKTAFTNLMIRNGVPTDSARTRADELINPNMSLDQIKGIVEQAKISGSAVIDALAEAKGDISGAHSVPSGVDPSLWQHMTPEEKALWQTPSQ